MPRPDTQHGQIHNTARYRTRPDTTRPIDILACGRQSIHKKRWACSLRQSSSRSTKQRPLTGLTTVNQDREIMLLLLCRNLQVIMLKLIKSGEYKLVMKTMELMAAKGAYARNFLVHVLMLEESFNTGRIGVRAFDEMDLALLQFLIGGLEIPMKPLQDISSILQIAIAVNDPLLLNYAIDVGADVNDNTLNIKPLANAIARGNKEVTDMLIGNGAKL